MTPQQLDAIRADYSDGELSDLNICAKHGIQQSQLDVIVWQGFGTPIAPQPLTRGKIRGIHGNGETLALAATVLAPEEMAASPLETVEALRPNQRESALLLNDNELTYCNLVHRGIAPPNAAAAAFSIFNKQMAIKKAGELTRSEYIKEYMNAIKGGTLCAPLRGKTYLEAVLHKVIDRSMNLTVVYDLNGRPMEGVCGFNYKAAIAASALLAKIKGWDNPTFGNDNAETQRDRLRRLVATHQESLNDE